MSLNANNQSMGGGGQYEPMEPGTYPGRLVQVIDLGLQAQPPYQGQEKDPVRMLATTYEFVDEFMKDEDGNDQEDKPKWLTEMFPFHNLASERAKSTKRYNSLDPNHVHGGDWTKLLATPCNITVVNNPGKGKNAGKVFDNIAEITAMREKDVKRTPELVNPPVFFDLEDPDIEVFNKLPPFIRKKIQSNLNYEGSKLQELIANSPKQAAEPKKEESVNTSEEDLDDEIPF